MLEKVEWLKPTPPPPPNGFTFASSCNGTLHVVQEDKRYSFAVLSVNPNLDGNVMLSPDEMREIAKALVKLAKLVEE